MSFSSVWWNAPPLSVAPTVRNVAKQSVFWHPTLPKLGLVLDRRLRFRVYVLDCASKGYGEGATYYVGITTADGLVKRLETHFSSSVDAAHFTSARKPKSILGIWPVANAAAEAYVFNHIFSLFFPKRWA